MKKIIIIIPYFGEFPNYFQLFLNSCKKNRTINWAIITDNDEEYVYPPNVMVVRDTFDNIRARIKDRFDFNPSIDSVHKLCEYKPAYGFLFPEIVKDYDYWGYGDVDLIYGDLRTFLKDDVLSFDKVFTLGHFTLIKNTIECNEMFMQEIDGELLYKKAFQSSKNFNFDEDFQDKVNINSIFRKNNKKIFDVSYAADIYTKSSDFRLDFSNGKIERRLESFFIWSDGHLYRYQKKKGTVEKKEYMYIHLQKRRMKLVDGIKEYRLYKIIPNCFCTLEVDEDEIEKQFDRIRKKYLNLQYFRIRFKNLKCKIINVKESENENSCNKY